MNSIFHTLIFFFNHLEKIKTVPGREEINVIIESLLNQN